MGFKKAAINEELGNSATHFFKSGNVIRSAANKPLDAVRALLPKHGPNGTRVEYDVWYDLGDNSKVHGYVYTDIMTMFVYVRAAGAYWSHKVISEAAEGAVTDDGLKICEAISNTAADKYMLRKSNVKAPFVIFLAGTNIIEKATDWGKLKNAVDQGAKLKCHPLTAPPLLASLRRQFGAENILDKKLSGHALLEQASIVGCTDNSEMGLVALSKGKTVYRFGPPAQHFTYSALYNSIWQDGMPNKNRWLSILSNPNTGLIPSIETGYSAEDRMSRFFAYFSKVPHVAPKHTNP
jgi:hypothetical protein